jgi:glycosyltransferase involved in cell wall biosynthesis
VIPCLDEAVNIEQCVRVAWDVLDEHGIPGEVIVVDNGSTDGSGDIARAAGAHVVEESRRGYGNAYLAGFEAARGDYIVMGDADLTYDFRDIPRFVDELERGSDLVMGDRFHRIHAGAMPWLHQHVGNPVLTKLINGIYRAGVRDAYCGMRAVRREALPRLDLNADGMEFGLEMIIRAAEERLDISSIPIELHPRGGESKLSTFRDGWRSLHLILVRSPRHLFMLPGALMIVLGVAVGAVVLTDVTLFGRHWYDHALIAASLLIIVGVQLVGLGICAEVYATDYLSKKGTIVERLRRRGVRLEHGLLVGGCFVLAGLALGGTVLGIWASRGFGELAERQLAIVAATAIVIGTQIVFSSLFLSLLRLGRRGSRIEPTNTVL